MSSVLPSMILPKLKTELLPKTPIKDLPLWLLDSKFKGKLQKELDKLLNALKGRKLAINSLRNPYLKDYLSK